MPDVPKLAPPWPLCGADLPENHSKGVYVSLVRHALCNRQASLMLLINDEC